MWHGSTRRETLKILSQIPPLSPKESEELFRGELDTERVAMIQDPDYRKFAALAYATKALLISNDDDLLERRGELEIRVETSRGTLDGLRS